MSERDTSCSEIMQNAVLLFVRSNCRSIISYHLFSFRGSVQDYKIHIDMEIASLFKKSRSEVNIKVYNNFSY